MTETAESLRQFLTPDETAAQLLKRVAVEPLLTGVPFFDGRTRLRPNHLALISGCTGSGKTELLIQVQSHAPVYAKAALEQSFQMVLTPY